MLTPEYLEAMPEPVLALYREAEIAILRNMAERIARYDYWIPAADWQNRKLKEAGVTQEEILRILSKYTGKTEDALRELMQQATAEGLRSDISVYEAAGETVPPISESEPLVQTLNAGFRATRQTMRNLTRTTANTATQQFERALDAAWMQVRSGAVSYDQAIRNAVKGLAQAGVESIRYPSGHVDKLEVAVRRAVVTGVHQTALQLQLQLAAEMGADLVEVSAHAGARPSHAVWQGKIYSISGTSKKYPSLVEKTGYGTGAGLGGWNCSHDFSPWFEGSPRSYSKELQDSYNAKSITYNGKQMTEYEASQVQRSMERNIRKWKREYEATQAAGLDTSEAAAKIKSWQEKLKDFTEQTGLKRQSAREQIPKAESFGLKAVKSGGIITGGLDRFSDEADNHAKRYYASVRKMTTDCERISKNTGYAKDEIQAVKQFVFMDKHDLGDGIRRFDPSYEMAQSWQRLIDGTDIKQHDLTLLKHEMMEKQLMDSGLSQDEAHILTSRTHNYQKEADEYYASTGRNQTER